MTKSIAQNRRRARRRQTVILSLLGIIASMLLLAALLFVLSRGAGAVQGTVQPLDYEGMPQTLVSIGQADGYGVGSPDAPVTLIEFCDFGSAHCANIAPEVHELISTYTTTGDLLVVFMPTSWFNEYSLPAAKAAVCVGDQGRFWQMYDVNWELYWYGMAADYYAPELQNRAAMLGVDITAYLECLDAPQTVDALDAIKLEYDARELRGIPSLLLNDNIVTIQAEDMVFEDVSEQIDALLGE